MHIRYCIYPLSLTGTGFDLCPRFIQFYFRILSQLMPYDTPGPLYFSVHTWFIIYQLASILTWWVPYFLEFNKWNATNETFLINNDWLTKHQTHRGQPMESSRTTKNNLLKSTNSRFLSVFVRTLSVDTSLVFSDITKKEVSIQDEIELLKLAIWKHP